MKSQDERLITLSRHIRHLRHHRINGATEKLQLIEGMTLGFNQVRIRMIAAAFTAEAPRRKNNIAQTPLSNCLVCHLNGTRITMVKVDGKKQIAPGSLFQKRVGFVEIEDQRFL